MRAPWLKYIFDSIAKTRNREGGESGRGGKKYSANQGKWGDKGESKLLNSFMNGSRDQGDLMGKEARLPCS